MARGVTKAREYAWVVERLLDDRWVLYRAYESRALARYVAGGEGMARVRKAVFVAGRGARAASGGQSGGV